MRSSAALKRRVALPDADVGTDAGGIEGPVTPPSAVGTAHLPALDGVRGLAVLTVIVYHAFTGMPTPSRLDAVVGKVMSGGWAGVDLFFALSGFLITGILLEKRGSRRYLRSFMARRALRIMPLYLFFVLLAVAVLVPVGVLEAARNQPVREHIGWFLAFAPNLLVARDEWSSVGDLGYLWSIGVEEQFYLVWPFVVMWLAPTRLRTAALAMAVAAPVLRVAAAAGGVKPLALYVFPLTHMDGLVLGAFAATALRTGVRPDLLRRAFGWGAALSALPLLAIVLLQGKLSWAYRSVHIVGYSAIAVIATWLVVRCATTGPEDRLTRSFQSRPARALGDYSYSLYLFHPIVLLCLERAGLAPDIAPVVGGSSLPASMLRAILTLAISYAIAMVTWRLLERPALALKRHFRG